jgi:AraC-like DNA-binding protein
MKLFTDPDGKFQMLKLLRAELVKDNEITISSVAIDCGFNDPGYFSRIFKQEFGITPNEWRAEVN